MRPHLEWQMASFTCAVALLSYGTEQAYACSLPGPQVQSVWPRADDVGVPINTLIWARFMSCTMVAFLAPPWKRRKQAPTISHSTRRDRHSQASPSSTGGRT